MMRLRMLVLKIIAWLAMAAPGGAAPATGPSKPSTAPALGLQSPLPTSPGFHYAKLVHPIGGKPMLVATGVFLPPGYFASKERFPLVITLHNRGSEGNDADRGKLSYEGLPLMLAQDNWDNRGSGDKPKDGVNLRKEAKFIALAPQCPAGWRWESPQMPQVIEAWIAQLAKAYRIDEDRIYLTGFSNGGTSTWSLAAAMPKRFAAIAPLSFRLPRDAKELAKTVSSMGVCIAQGDQDQFPAEFDAMKQALEATQHPNYQVRIVKGGNHWCYASIYRDPQFLDWLLAQRRRPTTAPAQAGK